MIYLVSNKFNDKGEEMSIIGILFMILLLGVLIDNRNSALGTMLKIFLVLLVIIAFSPLLLIIAILFIIYFIFGGRIKTNYTYYSNDDWEKFRNAYNRNQSYGGYSSYNSYSNYGENVYDNRENEYQEACKVIGADPSDSFEVKKKKRNTLLKKYHPDFYQDENDKKKATELTNKINNAWDIIERYHGFK